MRRIVCLLALLLLRAPLQAAEATVEAPLGPKEFIEKATQSLRAKDYAQADQNASQAITAGYEHSSAYNIRSAARSYLGRFEEAIADADRAVALSPAGAVGYANRAAARAGIKAAPEEILADLKRAAELDPNNYKARYEAASPPPKVEPAPVVVAPAPTPPQPKPEAPKPVAAALEKKPAAPIIAPLTERKDAPPQSHEPAFDLLALLNALGAKGWGAILGLVAVLAALHYMSQKQHRLTRVRFASVISFGPPMEEFPLGAVVGGRYIVGRVTMKQPGLEFYEARDLEDQPRMIKRLLPPPGAPGSFSSAWARAQKVADFKHPVIERVETVFQDGQHVCLVCDHQTGSSLRDQREKLEERRWEAAEALRILKPVCEGLHAAHSAGIVHGRLALASIRATAKTVKIVDFGLPPMLGVAEGAAVGGLAPESDLFALGICLYEMLTGVPPVFTPQATETLDWVFRPASSAASGLPHGIDNLLATALSRQTSKRFRSAMELYEAFRALVQPARK